jgi:hypothetical protein
MWYFCTGLPTYRNTVFAIALAALALWPAVAALPSPAMNAAVASIPGAAARGRVFRCRFFTHEGRRPKASKEENAGWDAGVVWQTYAADLNGRRGYADCLAVLMAGVVGIDGPAMEI